MFSLWRWGRSLKTKDRRKNARIKWLRPIILETEYGNMLLGHTVSLSKGGAGLHIAGQLNAGEEITVYILIDSRWRITKATVVYSKNIKRIFSQNLKEVGIKFSDKTVNLQIWRYSMSHSSKKHQALNKVGP